ncbi:MAG: GGDEF domain-containing protein [Proteobacteria bacterium]|nr:GGDEF domain-containing protein [Pseudomonadota bacterium]
MSDRDELTDLLGRRAFLATLDERIHEAGEQGGHVGLLLVDIDRFTQINVTYGFPCGDRVLRHFARQLAAVARNGDGLARVGDNRFALILPKLMNRGHAELAAQKLLRLLEVPFEHDDARLRLQATVGVALFPQHAPDALALLARAEFALALARHEDRRYGFAPDGAEIGSLSYQ